jgi:sigma-E factor negative regulatory protein RseC
VILTRGVVVEAQAGCIEVLADGESCALCAQAGGCPVTALSRLLCRSAKRIRVDNSSGAKVGDRVAIGVPEGALWRSALVVYVVPVALSLSGALAGAHMGSTPGDAAAALGAVSGLGAGALFILFATRFFLRPWNFSPVLVSEPDPL